MRPPGTVVLETHLEALGPKRRGKVRDIYELDDSLLLVATDRISAYDVILEDGIPAKGYVLTQLSRFWFDRLSAEEGGVRHHLVTTEVEKFPPSCRPYREILEGRSMLVKKAEPLPVECIVRGYLSGSGWKEYQERGTVCGERLPNGLRESERLQEPIFTPSTKATEGHDLNISFDRMKELIGEKVAKEVRAKSLSIYRRASVYAEGRGILIADTKLEFGFHRGSRELILIDEVLTPDSSRFWPKEGYVPGKPQPSFDKQYVRDYLDSVGFTRRPPPPRLPQEVIQKTTEKYLDALTRLTGHGDVRPSL